MDGFTLVVVVPLAFVVLLYVADRLVNWLAGW